jgi:hypothetical protein
VDPTCCKDTEGGTRQRRAPQRPGDSQGLAAVDRALNLKCPRVHCHHAPRPAHTKAVTRQLHPPQGTCPGLDHVTHCTKDLTRRRRCGPQAEDAGRVVHLLTVKSEGKNAAISTEDAECRTSFHACSTQLNPSRRGEKIAIPITCRVWYAHKTRQAAVHKHVHASTRIAGKLLGAPQLRLSHARPRGTVALWRWDTVWGTQAQVGDDAFVDHRTNVTVFPSL